MMSLLAQAEDTRDFLGHLTLAHFLVVSAIMFALGLIGFLSRRNLIIMFLCTEMMFQAAGIALIAFSRYHLNHTGEVFVISNLSLQKLPQTGPLAALQVGGGEHDVLALLLEVGGELAAGGGLPRPL